MIRRRGPLAWGAVAVLAVAVIVAGIIVTRSDGPAPTRRPTDRVAALPRGTVVAFLGDSFTQGAGATAPARRWTSLVAARYGWREINVGIGGTGFQQPPPYLDRVAQLGAARPAVVIVAGGLNDLAVMAQNPAGEAAAIDTTFTALRTALPKAVLLAVRPFFGAGPSPALLTELGDQERAAVRAVGGAYLDIGQPLAGRPQDISADGVHPNDSGHRALADAVEQSFARTPVPSG